MFYLGYCLPSFLSRFQFAEFEAFSAPRVLCVLLSHFSWRCRAPQQVVYVGSRSFKRAVITFSNSSGSRNLLFFFFFFERHIFANCKWNSNPGEFKLISRFGIYITQVCLKHAKIISCLAQGCPRGPKPKPNKMIARNGEISSYFISVTFPVVLDICAPKAVE